MRKPDSLNGNPVGYGESIQYMKRYIKRGRTPHVAAVQEALRGLMVGQIMSYLDIPKEERETLDLITREYFGMWERTGWTRDGDTIIEFRK